MNDSIFTLTINNNNNKFFIENSTNIVSKTVIIRELNYINLNDFSEALACMKIEKLNVYCIDNTMGSNIINYTSINNGCIINYMEMKPKHFIKFLNLKNNKFLDYNLYTMYIVKGGNYIDIKNLFTRINDNDVNLVKGGSQKAHMLSPLDFRLSSYLMAMFNFDYKSISCLNTFNDISKDRYLSNIG